MKKYGTRIIYILIALLFLFTSLGFSFLVIWESRQQSKQSSQSSDLQKALNESQNNSKEGKLEGTKLANFTPVDKVDKLQIVDEKVGTGDTVKAGDTVTAHYTGAVASTGIIFQSSHDTGQPVPFSLDQVIKGWTEGVPGMKVGGVRRLIIPADKAYGANPPQGSGIPANAPLVFDIELVKIGQ